MEPRVYKIKVNEDDQVTGFIRNSFVELPSVEYEYYAFDENNGIMKFQSDDTSQSFMGVSILADTPIPRLTDKGELYYVVFDKDTIRTILNKLVIEDKDNEVSLYHDASKQLDGVYMVERFQVEKGRVETPKFPNIPDGSLITTYYVKDKEKYHQLLNDEKFRGFSIEIKSKVELMFESSFQKMQEEIILNNIKTILASDLSDNDKEIKIKNLINGNS
jgi:hypothetical protein